MIKWVYFFPFCQRISSVIHGKLILNDRLQEQGTIVYCATTVLRFRFQYCYNVSTCICIYSKLDVDATTLPAEFAQVFIAYPSSKGVFACILIRKS